MKETRNLTGLTKGLFLMLVLIIVIIAINQLFNLNMLGKPLMVNSYLYLTLAMLLAPVFLLFPATKRKPSADEKVPIYDYVLFFVTFIIYLYMAFNGSKISVQSWEYNASTLNIFPAIIMWILVIEALRRVSGLVLALIATVFSLYPVISPFMPGFLEGQGRNILQTATFHVYGTQSIIGIPLDIFGSLIIGFIIFGVILSVTGAGTFFMNLSNAFIGSTRGGSAKIAVLASAFFGSLSGSPVSNVITTGSVTIPLMKQSGFKGRTAGAIEACASTGGVFMPPVMGATAFVMASIIGVPYSIIVVAAIIPSVLYFLALFLQIDTIAARDNLRGLPREDVDSLRNILKQGWIYLISFIILIYLLIFMKLEPQAPFIASGILLVLSQTMKSTRFNIEKLKDLVMNTGKALSELVAILAGVGFIIGSLSFTGLSISLSSEIISLAGENLILLLILGSVVSFILGMGVTITAVYVFLAVVLAPALTSVGVNILAAHFFILYWGMLSNITPPVAIASFAGASIANSNPMQTALESMKIGAIIYLVPFYFVINPTLILTGDFAMIELIQVLITAIFGIIVMANASSGYVYGIGKVELANPVVEIITRSLLFISGALIVFPEGESSLLNFHLPLYGFAMTLIIVLILYFKKKAESEKIQNVS